MPGLNFSRLFRGRWAALFWAGGIVFSAWSFASDQPASDESAEPAPTNAQMAALTTAF
ncbi:MAG: hypothetical protein ACSLE1_06080 [Sphingobium sp.]